MSTDQDKIQVQDWIAETPESITSRLEAAKASQAQFRLTIGVMALISMMMLIAAYNAYLSYDYGWTLAVTKRQIASEGERTKRINAAPEAKKEATAREIAAENAVAEVLTEQALKDWASSRIVQISLLGIRVSVDDAAVLGSAVLFVLSLWLLLVTRREYHTIGSLLWNTDSRPDNNRKSLLTTSKESSGVDTKQRWLIFHTIISNSIFVTLEHSLSIVHSPPATESAESSRLARFRAWLNKAGFGFVRSFFFLFPVSASLIVFGLDRLSYSCYLPDPFLPGAGCEGTDRPFYAISSGVFVVCWFLLALCCWRSRLYSRATEEAVHRYGNKLNEDLLQRESSAQS